MSLRRIVLRDFVIVQELELELRACFCVLTGETGAGKSILIDALQLALGARADSGVVREGAARCEVAVEFDLPGTLLPWLAEQGLSAEDNNLLLRRTVDADGRSRAWINGSAATLNQLRALAGELVDIHGQHAWQSLTRPDAVRQLLDGFAALDTAAAQRCWTHWRGQRKALQGARERQHSLQQERERLSWQIGEIDQLAPQPGEWQDLNQQHSRLAHAQALLSAAQTATAALAEDDSNATRLLHRACNALAAQAHIEPRLGAAAEQLQAALAQVDDSVHSLRQYARSIDLDPASLDSLDQRLAQWIALARRQRCAPEDLATLHVQRKAELSALEQALDLDALLLAERQAWDVLQAEMQDLSNQRQQAAPRLAQAVTQTMQTLGLQGGCFEVELLRLDEPQPHGWDQVEFLVAGHSGVTARPIGKVASGGELARIALAISVVTSRLGQAPTLIFDEVDAGIGGMVGHTVGQLLRQLGAERQVLAVTHLAQVAACAQQHLLVNKQQSGGQTVSTVQEIEQSARVRELARMLGGGESSQASLAHAREMLAQPQDRP